MLTITRDGEKIRLTADTNFSDTKFTWIDGIYFLVSNANISIWLEKEAEEKLIEFLFNPKIEKEE